MEKYVVGINSHPSSESLLTQPSPHPCRCFEGKQQHSEHLHMFFGLVVVMRGGHQTRDQGLQH